MSFTILKKNPTQGEITSSLTGSTGDGAGLHFDGAAGNIDIASPPDLGTKFSFEFVVKADSWSSSAARHLVDFGNGGRFAFAGQSTTLQIYDSQWRDFGVAVLDDLKVHHLVVTVDGTAATLYDNGNQVATATLGSSSDIDSCSDAAIGSYYNDSTLTNFNGTIYRARFYNKALEPDEVQTAYERADVDFADQYGSQTSLVDAGASVFTSGTYSWSAYGSNTIANVGNALEITYVDHASGAQDILRNASDLTTDLTVGKRYRLTVDAKYTGGSAGAKLQLSLAGSNTDFATLTTSLVTYTYEFTTDTAAGGTFRMSGMSAGNVVTIDNWYLREIGCVSDYDLAYAQPALSTLIQDRSNAADGVASSSGVTQVQPITQLNSTSARIGSTQLAAGTSPYIPADGEIIAGSVTAKTGTTGGITIDASGQTDTTARFELKADRPSADQDACDIRFYNNNAQPIAVIAAVKGSSANDTDGKLDFYTSNAKRLTIGSTGLATFTRDSSTVIIANRTTDNGDAITVRKDNYDRLRLGTEGITFPNGANAPAAAANNRLDYYGEGSWTPTLVRGGPAITAGVAYSNQAGNYTRIGKVVYYWFDMTISTLDNSTLNPSSGIFGIGGLPFQSADAAAGGYGAPSFRSMTAVASSIRNNNNSSFVQSSSTYISLFWFNGSAVEIGLDTVTTDLTTGRLTGEGFYFTS